MKLTRRDLLRSLSWLSLVGVLPKPLRQKAAELFAVPQRPCGRFRIQLSQYPQLATVNGSVKISIPDAVGEVPARLIVTRLSESTFAAVDDICPHAGCLVSPYQASLGGLPCPCHGSLFRPTGEVVRGPATRALRSFQTFYEPGSDVVEIEIPGYTAVAETATALELSLHPNPASEWIELRGSLPQSGNVSFTLFTVGGQRLLAWEQWLPEGPFVIRYPLQGFASGMYLLRVRTSFSAELVRTFQVVR
jgi:cytochrome b6-f complex iron-sulfur subunit